MHQGHFVTLLASIFFPWRVHRLFFFLDRTAVVVDKNVLFAALLPSAASTRSGQDQCQALHKACQKLSRSMCQVPRSRKRYTSLFGSAHTASKYQHHIIARCCPYY